MSRYSLSGPIIPAISVHIFHNLAGLYGENVYALEGLGRLDGRERVNLRYTPVGPKDTLTP